jgi:hypothetical protein
METIEWDSISDWAHGSGSGPWVMVDLENGVYAGGQSTGTVSANTSLVANYVTLMVKGPSGNHMTLKGGDAHSGSLVSSMTEYVRPRTIQQIIVGHHAASRAQKLNIPPRRDRQTTPPAPHCFGYAPVETIRHRYEPEASAWISWGESARS